MFEWLFGGKKDVKELEERTKSTFSLVKHDIESVSEWIKHLNNSGDKLKLEVDDIKEDIASIKMDIEGLKNVLLFVQPKKRQEVFTTPTAQTGKQTAVQGVQTAVQTAVQAGVLRHFSVMERAIILVLLNSDMKLSYEDVATMLGKSKTTIRGQINAIRQKEEGVIEESLDAGGKKRFYIPEKIKEILIKNNKVRAKRGKYREESDKTNYE